MFMNNPFSVECAVMPSACAGEEKKGKRGARQPALATDEEAASDTTIEHVTAARVARRCAAQRYQALWQPPEMNICFPGLFFEPPFMPRPTYRIGS